MDIYHIWCNLKANVKDVEFTDNVKSYLDHLKELGQIHTYRITRRKLGLGPPHLPESTSPSNSRTWLRWTLLLLTYRHEASPSRVCITP
jgi:hypothetical protein